MARIRTVKPQLFRHEGLQELESSKPTLRPMLVFAGLFTLADREGRFEWRPKQIKLDILPFVNFEMSETLETLAEHGFIEKYEAGGKTYGHIPTWHEHQCPNVKEPASRIPAPSRNHTGTMPECGEGEREKEREVVDGSDSQILEIAKAYPTLANLRNELEIPHAIAILIIKAVETDGAENVLRGVRGYAASLDNVKFAKEEYKFFSNPSLYRQFMGSAPKVTKWREVTEEELAAKREALRASGVTQ